MITIIIIAAVLYLLFHVAAGHRHYRRQRARGLSPNFYWSSVRGPYASVRTTESGRMYIKSGAAARRRWRHSRSAADRASSRGVSMSLCRVSRQLHARSASSETSSTG